MRRVLLTAILLFATTAGLGAERREIVVSAASSLADVLQELASLYQMRGGDHVAINTGASNTLARQITAGARVDVFISADEAQMNAVGDDVVTGTRVDLLSNRLAIAVPDDRPRQFRSARDLLDPAIRRVAIGDPAAVPAGVYARQYLEHLGIWSALQSKLVPAGTVRLALAAVERGAADAAIVYASDLVSARRARVAYAVPASEGPRIVYPAALIRSGSNPEGGRGWLAFLQTREADAIFTRAGFSRVR
jgi:molybdate transport system substrate-binding protein